MEISSYAAALELENRGQALLTRGADMPEALAAFKEKREPQFTGLDDASPSPTISATARPRASGCATACSGT